MSRTARLAASLTALAAAATTLVTVGTAQADSVPTTRLTIRTPSCDGCDIQLFQAIKGRDHVWQSKLKRSHDGKVTFTVPTRRTHGMSMSVRPRWERTDSSSTGYVTLTAFRYQGHAAGSRIGFRAARRQDHGSACWAGTDKASKTLTLGVRKVRVQGIGGETDGSIAWLPSQARTWAPMYEAFRGVVGGQEVPLCEHP
jgi:hypothetical protein